MYFKQNCYFLFVPSTRAKGPQTNGTAKGWDDNIWDAMQKGHRKQN